MESSAKTDGFKLKLGISIRRGDLPSQYHIEKKFFKYNLNLLLTKNSLGELIAYISHGVFWVYRGKVFLILTNKKY